MGGKCSKCDGVFHSSCYDFHHIDPTEKDIDPGNLIRGSEVRLYEELEKCVLLCANCHRMLHWELSNLDTDWEEPLVEVIKLTVNGSTKTLSEWAEHTGLKYETIRARINNYGWTPEEAVSLTPNKRRKNEKV